MKKVVSMGLGVLLSLVLSSPVAADENASSLASAFEAVYSAVAAWLGSDVLDLASSDNSEVNSLALGEEANSTAGVPPGPGATVEMSPMTLPGG